jgi:hypothetical protein
MYQGTYRVFLLVVVLLLVIAMAACTNLSSMPTQSPVSTPASEYTTTFSPTSPIPVSTTPTSAPLILQVGSSGQYHSIQEAINAAQTGSIIQVAQGTYKENIEIIVPKVLTIQGGWNQEFTVHTKDSTHTIIDGNNTGRVVSVEAKDGINIALAIEDITVQNGRSEHGAGIYADCNGEKAELNLTLNNIQVINNASTISDGGLGLKGNKGSLTVTIINSKISGNSSSIGDGGGMIVHSQSDAVINILVERTIISDNQATYGGGIFAGAHDNSTINMILNNNIIYNNKAENGGGGLFSLSGIAMKDKPGGIINWTLTNNTITGNISHYGSGIASNTGQDGSTSIHSHNDIIWGNAEVNGVGDVSISNVGGVPRSITFNIDYSDIGVASIWSFRKDVYVINNYINKDPLFEDVTNGDYRLKDGSPCIDIGDPDSSFNDGHRPPAKGTQRNDIGAYGGPKNHDSQNN